MVVSAAKKVSIVGSRSSLVARALVPVNLRHRTVVFNLCQFKVNLVCQFLHFLGKFRILVFPQRMQVILQLLHLFWLVLCGFQHLDCLGIALSPIPHHHCQLLQLPRSRDRSMLAQFDRPTFNKFIKCNFGDRHCRRRRNRFDHRSYSKTLVVSYILAAEYSGRFTRSKFAGKNEIIFCRCAAMFFGDRMVDFMRVGLRKS
mgnify:CR=1 FL=1